MKEMNTKISGASMEGAASACGDVGSVGSKELEILRRERDEALRQAGDATDQLQALVQAIRLLKRIVATPPRPAGSIAPPAESREDSEACFDGIEEEDRLLERLQNEWKLEETGFTALYNACKMMRDNLALSAAEASGAVDEVHAANGAAIEAELRLEKVTGALHMLWKENSRLKSKLEKKRQEKKLLIHSLRQCANELDERRQSELHDEYMLRALELSHSALTATSDTSENTTDDERNVSPPPCLKDCTLVTELAKPTVRIERKMSQGGPCTSQSGKGQQRKIYHITFPNRRIGLKLHAVPLSPRELGHVSCRPARKPLLSLTDEQESNKERPSKAFLVCGVRNLDPSLSKKPLVGSRLIAIDDLPLDRGEWSLQDICRIIHSGDGPITMSFRNDILTKVQMEELQMAMS